MLASVKAALALSRVGRAGELQSSDAFNAAIRLERARVDRNEHAFSLVVFDARDPVRQAQGGPKASADVTRLLVRSLNARIRSTDEIGWFDDCHIGVLLPYTSRRGAEKFVDDIVGAAGRLSVDGGAGPVKHTIYTYPANWHYGNDDSCFRRGSLPPRKRGENSGVQRVSGQLHFTDICSKWGRAEPGDSSGITRHNINTALATEWEDSTAILEPPKPGPLPTWKRIMDIGGSLFGLALATPFLLVHTVILKMVSPGPVFFRQRRIGYMGRPFTMWKLRTMDVSADTSAHQEHVSQLISGANKRDYDAPMAKLDSDPHIIPAGIILRKMCLDEVPQLINVLVGEMSLVGPRPPLVYEVDEFLKWQHRRFDAVPGMTGLWQVSGKNRLSFSQMIRLDIRYSRRKTLLLDLIILLRTPLAIVSQIKDSLVPQGRQRLTVEGRHV